MLLKLCLGKKDPLVLLPVKSQLSIPDLEHKLSPKLPFPVALQPREPLQRLEPSVRLLVVHFQCFFDVCATLASVVSRKEVSTLPTIHVLVLYLRKSDARVLSLVGTLDLQSLTELTLYINTYIAVALVTLPRQGARQALTPKP